MKRLLCENCENELLSRYSYEEKSIDTYINNKPEIIDIDVYICINKDCKESNIEKHYTFKGNKAILIKG